MKFKDYKIEYEIKEIKPKKTSIILTGIKYALIKTVIKFFETLSRFFFFFSYLIPIGFLYFAFMIYNGKALNIDVILVPLFPLLSYFLGYITCMIADYFENTIN